MRRPSKKAINVARAARIQRAVVGLSIPLTRMVGMYKHAEQLLDEGVDDPALVQGLRNYLGVV